MNSQRYSVAPYPIETLLTWVKSGEIAIPEIQRPFVWDAVKVRNLLDSLYNGYPVGYLISWRNPTIKLKDGSLSSGKRILIDGQQRITALMTALLGKEVLTKGYRTVRIRIAFHPQKGRFEVHNPAIAKDRAWVEDIAMFFDPDADLFEIKDDYVALNPGADQKSVGKAFQRVNKIVNNHVGVIELAEDLDIENRHRDIHPRQLRGHAAFPSGFCHVENRRKRVMRREPTAQGNRLFLSSSGGAGILLEN